MLIDNHNRIISYLRLAVTDRCNLRCTYCMPEEGIQYMPKDTLLTYEEMLRLCRILAGESVDKVRITGGEPFLRKDLIFFLKELASIEGMRKISITSNGTLLRKHLPSLKQLGITDINLSLDSLDRQRFLQITRRDELAEVLACFEEMLTMEFKVKINMVLMSRHNHEDILPMVELARKSPVEVRFIEEMPFNGAEHNHTSSSWTYRDLLAYLITHLPGMESHHMKAGATAMNYSIPGFAGSVGIIAAHSRTFCGTCNRIRITPSGMLKTCLYDNGIFDLKNLMRNSANDEEILEAIKNALNHRAKDGFEAERNRGVITESMASIGG